MPYPNQPNHKNGRMRHPQSRARPPINNSNDMQHPQVHRQSRPTPPINNSNDMQHPQVHRQSRPTPPINNSNDMQHPQVHGQSRPTPPIDNSNDMQHPQSHRQSRSTTPIVCGLPYAIQDANCPRCSNSNDMQHPQVHGQSRPTPPIDNSNDMQRPQVHGQSRANSNDMQDTQSNITNNVIHVSIEQLLFTQLNQINSDCLALISNRPRASFNPAGPNPNLAKEIYFLNLYRKLENARTDLVMNCMFNGRKITKALQ
eukprot:450778_1